MGRIESGGTGMTTAHGRSIDAAARTRSRRPGELWAALSGHPFVLSSTVFAAAMAFRSFGLLSKPRFLAEEGFVYYQYMQHSSFIDGLFFVFRGNYQFLTNLICLASVAMPDRLAAYPTTYLGAAVDLYACVLLAEALQYRGASRVTVALAVLCFALQPAGYEVFLNATNVMWVCSACTLFICLSEERRPWSGRAWSDYASVAAFGLTGVPSLTLLPFFALEALAQRTAHRAVLLSILAAAAAVQGAVILHHEPDPDRAMTLTWHSVVPVVFQTTLTDLVPAEALDALGARIVTYDASASATALQVALLGLASLAAALAGAWRSLSRVDRVIVPGALVFVSAFNEFAALGPPEALHSGWAAGHYFFLGNTCFLSLIALSRDGGSALRRGVVTGAAALIVSNAAVQSFGAGWIKAYDVGPSVSGQVRACAGKRPCPISYPPHGPGAEFMMDRTRIPGYALPE